MNNFDPSRVAARVSYLESGRSFTMASANSVDVRIDTCSWAMGGTVVHVDAEEGNRSVQMAFGIEQYIQLFECSLTKFLQLDIEILEDEGAEARLEARNEFLMHAAEAHPRQIAELSRVLRRLSDEAHESLGRLSTLQGQIR